MKNKFLEQKERGETILFTELLKEIPDDDILLELFPDQTQPGRQMVTRRELQILNLHLDTVSYRDIAEKMSLTIGQVAKILQKVKRILENDMSPCVSVNMPLLNPRHYAEKLDVLSERQQDVWVLYAQGESRQRIAEKLSISPSAVTAHLRHADRRFREHDRYCAALERNQEAAFLPVTRGEVKIIIKALKLYEQELERGHSFNIRTDFTGKLPWETQIVANLCEKAQAAIRPSAE
ncbi:MAG: hypothetical protein HFF62_15440 [Oscillospiraceae bacterium]|nr:hypothetical protein [Oscillospiraceae bacterium]